MRRLISPGTNGAVSPQRAESTTKIPHDPVNEQVLLVAAALDAGARTKLVSRLRPDAFLVNEHIELWIVLSELERQKLDYSPATLRQLSGGKADADYLESLIGQYAEAPSNLDHHITALEWDRTRAEAVKGPLSGLLEALRDPSVPPERVRALSESLSSTLARGTTSGLLRDPVALAKSARADLRARRERACYPYGIRGLDLVDDESKWRMVPGAAPGKVTIITGVPGSGKSLIAARIALAQAEAERRVVYGAWEMGSESTLDLLAIMRLGWSRYGLATGAIAEDQEAELDEARAWVQRYIRFVDVPGAPRIVGAHTAKGERATNERALDQIHSVIVETGADVFVADLWKRCLRRTEPDEEEHALVRQQAICEVTKCHGIILQQQRHKDVELRPDKRPTREGIKGSGAYAEIADTILGVHRPALWKAIDDITIEVDVLKQRWGMWPLAVEFDYDGDLGSITGGKTIPYDVTGIDLPGDDFLSPGLPGGKRRGKKK